MKLHANARLTVHGRMLLVQRVVEERVPVAQAAARAGVSERTAYRWIRRDREEGQDGLHDRSSRPHRSPGRTAPRKVEHILRLRRQGLVAWEIARQVKVPRSTVSRILGQRGLGRLRCLEPKEPVRRYERERPGELLHLDTKKLARITKGSGPPDPWRPLSPGQGCGLGASLQVIRQSALSNFVVGLAIAALALVTAMLLTNRLTRNVGILTVGAERLARGDLQVRVPEGSKDELGQLARTFNRMARELSEKEERILEEERLRKEQEFQQRMLQAENDRKSQELEEARRFQLSLLPNALPTLPGLEIGVHMTTATEVGRDY